MKNKNHSNIAKLAFDFYIMQMQWSLWYLGIATVIILIIPLFLSQTNDWQLNFVENIYSSSKIYLAIIALFSCFGMLGYMVKNGVTRKDYFYGTAIAAIGVSFSLMIITTIISAILYWVGYQPDLQTTSFLNTTSTWFVPILSLSIILLGYYIAGWVIAVGYYRFGGLKTVGFILLSLSYVSVIDWLWEGEIIYPFFSKTLSFSLNGIPIFYSFSITLILIGLALLLVRLMTKRIPIKVE
ncbi:hypothetical protein GCM10025886_25390 [Tetragenococcus halophilus subsp. flandriensis]|uniref:hypothetical protein n=1 Tax=Tetragenococcus halophilus TaxID=51669 RepID=UPI0023E9239E|nr:hypothetical protein [Tetragenococcus halophilus]GMA09386.1 hypothetical protein GCM10025886_25390 [Tetragenococcus halophilus subsp. flandriensis]